MASESTKKTFGKRAPDGAWEVPILGDIGFFGVNGEDLIRELSAVRPETVKFIIYSGGGAVYDAIAVAGFIREKGITCFAEIYGVCASAATVFAALAGPKNTAIAPGSTFLVHMPFGGDQKLIDNAAEFLADLYVKAYGWTKAEANKHMQADEGRGIFWTAKEAKAHGVVGEIMEVSAVAARLNINTPAMADSKPTVKVKANVKLAGMDIVRAALSEQGATVEVDAEVEQQVADDLAAKDARIAELEAENAELKASKPEEGSVVPVEELTQAKAKVTELEATIATKSSEVEAKEKALVQANAKVKELEAKIPAAQRTVANNQEAGQGRITNDPPTQAQSIVKEALKGANPLMVAQARGDKQAAK